MEELLNSIKDKAAEWGPDMVISIGIFLGFYILANMAKAGILKSAEKAKVNEQVSSLISKVAKVALIIVGVIIALDKVGLPVSTLVAGLGLTGFALGFALKDTVSNMLAGLLILIYRPLSVGDYIKMGIYEGQVQSIDLRYTILEREGRKILIPNSKLLTDPITILTGKVLEEAKARN